MGALALAAVAGQAQASSSATKDTQLVGTGATFPFPLISKWIPEVGKAYGINITYSPTGSGAGIAASPHGPSTSARPMPRCPTSSSTDCKGCVVIPWALAAVSIPYNLPGLNGRVHLNGATLANIYLGTITSWNDPAIKKLNPKLSLPDTKITPVYRSDGSGTTFAYTEYLSAVSGAVLQPRRQQHERQLPDRRRRAGSSGVAGVVKNTPGALTYVDAAYSIQNKLQFAMIQNRAGTFHDARAARDHAGGLDAAQEDHEPGAAEDRRSAQERPASSPTRSRRSRT